MQQYLKYSERRREGISISYPARRMVITSLDLSFSPIPEQECWQPITTIRVANCSERGFGHY